MPENLPLPANRAPLYPSTPQQGSPLGEKVSDEHRSGPLTANRIQHASFPTIRRGYDPKTVQAYLAQVAAEVTRLQQRLAAAYDENDRIKHNLRQWQTDHATNCCGPNSDRLLNAPTPSRWITQPPYPRRPPDRT